MSEFHDPLFLDEAQAIVGDFATDPADVWMLQQGITNFDESLVSMADPIYVGALRVLAEQRREDRASFTPKKPEDIWGWNEKWEDGLTLKRVQDIKRSADILPLLERMAALREHYEAEDVQEFKASGLSVEEPSSSGEELFAHQHPYMNDIREFLTKPPIDVTIKMNGKTYKTQVHGASVLAPTGMGKSAVAGRTLAAAEVGKQREDDPSRTKRALVVTSSTALADQMAGFTGDNTFLRFAPKDLTVGVCHSRRPKITNTDVVITTVDHFTAHTVDGKFMGEELGLLVVDETHHLTEPAFLDTFVNHWYKEEADGTKTPIPAVGFTGTSGYDAEKDVRHILPHIIEHDDTLSYMEEGILNSGQFFFMRVEGTYDDEHLEDLEEQGISSATNREARFAATRQAMVDFFTPLIAAGRRGFIFCEPGGEAENARLLTDAFRTQPLPDGTFITADCLNTTHNSGKENTRILNDYNAGKTQVLTSVGWGQEGLNAEFDFIGAGNVESLLKLKQIMGRGTRRSKEFPTTIYAQFFTPAKGRTAQTKTFLGALGLEQVEQGVIIGQQSSRGRISRIQRDKMGALQPSAFPESIQLLLKKAEGRVVGELLLNSQEIPADYVPFDTVYAPVKNQVSESSAKYRLDNAGYAWQGELIHKGRGRHMNRHYEPAAETFFTDNPLPPRATPDFKTVGRIAQELKVSADYLKKIYGRIHAEEGLKTEVRLGENGRVAVFYGTELRARFKEEIDKIPVAAPTDKSIAPLAVELKIGDETASKYAEELGIKSVYKRRANLKGFTWFITEQEEKRITQRVNKYPWAADGDWTLGRIAQEAGADPGAVRTWIKEEAWNQTYVRRTKTAQGYTRELAHWSESYGRQLAEQYKVRLTSLPAHLVPYSVIGTITNSNRSRARQNDLSTLFNTLVPLPGSRPVLCFAWDGLKRIHQEQGLRGEDVDPPDYARLPRGEDDTDPQRLTYARAYQLKFMTAARMGNPDGIID